MTHRRKPRRPDTREQARLNLKPLPWQVMPLPASDLDREVQEFADETRREPLPGQAEIEWGKT